MSEKGPTISIWQGEFVVTLLQAVRMKHKYRFTIGTHDGMYHVRLIGQPDSLQYFCNSLEDAVDAGISMRETQDQLDQWAKVA